MFASHSGDQRIILPQPKLRILQVQNLEQFQQFEPAIAALLNLYKDTLLDDFCEPDSGQLVRNTSTYLPWLWLLVNAESPEKNRKKEQENAVYGLACLSAIIPGRHAYVHGVSHPGIRRHPAVFELGHQVLNMAFNKLKVRKVKAEIEANNQGAKGYCRRMGFVREAHFRQDNRVGGQWQDVLIYSLFAEHFFNSNSSI